MLIEVHAAGIDRGVWHLMTGEPYLIRVAGFGLRKPKNPVLGLDVAGARALGMTTIRIRARYDDTSSLDDADFIVDSHDALRDLLTDGF